MARRSTRDHASDADFDRDLADAEAAGPSFDDSDRVDVGVGGHVASARLPDDEFDRDLADAEAAEDSAVRSGALKPGTVIGGDDRYEYMHVSDTMPDREARVMALQSRGWKACAKPADGGPTKVGYLGGQLWRKPRQVIAVQRERGAQKLRDSMRRAGLQAGAQSRQWF